ncbi:MAG: GYF domain-containing protein [Verrucomicrobiota bacterium]
MNWYYAEGTQQTGPITEADLDALFASGRINAATLVWREGMANWQPYGQVKPVPAGAPAGTVACSQCGGSFPPDEVIQYGGLAVCATCKPVFLQRLKEGASVAGSVPGGQLSPEEILARDYEIRIGDTISRSWTLVKDNFWPAVGAVFFVFLLLMGVGLIPRVGSFVQVVLQGPLTGGVYYFFLKLLRGEDASIGDAFSGFGPRFLHLMLVHVTTIVFAVLCFLPMIICLVALGLSVGASGGRGLGSAGSAMIGAVVLFGLIGVIGAVYLGTCWTFALTLVMDRGMSFWEAMQLSRRVVQKEWFMVFLLLVVAGIVAVLGILGCGVGIIVTLPIYNAAIAVAYEDIFSARGHTPA